MAHCIITLTMDRFVQNYVLFFKLTIDLITLSHFCSCYRPAVNLCSTVRKRDTRVTPLLLTVTILVACAALKSCQFEFKLELKCHRPIPF